MIGIHKEKNPHLKLWIGIFVFFWVLCIALVCFSFCFVAQDYKYKIDSSKKFIKAINHSAETGKAYNYVLTGSFEVDITELPADKFFYGHLNGNGYTITLISKNNRPMTSPIFGKIQEGAKVERLGIELNTVLGEDDSTADIAVLAKDNFGIVQDCFISISNIFIGSKCQNAAALINNNFGEVNSVCVDVNLVESSQSLDNWQCAFGTIATTNYAVVKNALIRVVFGDLDIFNSSYNNQSIGYVISKIGKNVSKTDMDSIYIFGDSSFWQFSLDAMRMTSTEVIKGEKPDNTIISEFIRYNGRVSNAWSASLTDERTGFPLLNK